MRKSVKKLIKFLPEEHENDTYHEVLEGTKFHGYNFWILGFTMFIACIGLNTDSLSAVIGAMLISPLMGPIQGLAFGLAINDLKLKKIALYNWLSMTIISLLASTLFFLVTPFDFNTYQLKAFKSATIFDILLAFFGGMAGFIGLIRKEGTKVLAGVAVATACMPPLCTAGYGLAKLDWQFFVGGLYFYLINCLFIGLATFLLTRFSKIHLRLNKEGNVGLVKWKWVFFITFMTIPSLYLAYQKYNQAKLESRTLSDSERIKILEEKLEKLESENSNNNNK